MFLICIYCSLRLLAVCLALELVADGQAFGVFTWAQWLDRAQSNSGRAILGEAWSPLGCC